MRPPRIEKVTTRRRASTCRHCGWAVAWVWEVTAAGTMRRLAVDPEPHRLGSYRLTGPVTDTLTSAHFVPVNQRLTTAGTPVELHRPHRDTCGRT